MSVGVTVELIRPSKKGAPESIKIRHYAKTSLSSVVIDASLITS